MADPEYITSADVSDFLQQQDRVYARHALRTAAAINGTTAVSGATRTLTTEDFGRELGLAQDIVITVPAGVAYWTGSVVVGLSGDVLVTFAGALVQGEDGQVVTSVRPGNDRLLLFYDTVGWEISYPGGFRRSIRAEAAVRPRPVIELDSTTEGGTTAVLDADHIGRTVVLDTTLTTFSIPDDLGVVGDRLALRRPVGASTASIGGGAAYATLLDVFGTSQSAMGEGLHLFEKTDVNEWTFWRPGSGGQLDLDVWRAEIGATVVGDAIFTAADAAAARDAAGAQAGIRMFPPIIPPSAPTITVLLTADHIGRVLQLDQADHPGLAIDGDLGDLGDRFALRVTGGTISFPATGSYARLEGLDGTELGSVEKGLYIFEKSATNSWVLWRPGSGGQIDLAAYRGEIGAAGTTGAETWAGQKTFSTAPRSTGVPDSGTSLLNRDQLDAPIHAPNYVQFYSAQTSQQIAQTGGGAAVVASTWPSTSFGFTVSVADDTAGWRLASDWFGGDGSGRSTDFGKHDLEVGFRMQNQFEIADYSLFVNLGVGDTTAVLLQPESGAGVGDGDAGLQLEFRVGTGGVVLYLRKSEGGAVTEMSNASVANNTAGEPNYWRVRTDLSGEVRIERKIGGGSWTTLLQQGLIGGDAPFPYGGSGDYGAGNDNVTLGVAVASSGTVPTYIPVIHNAYSAQTNIV